MSSFLILSRSCLLDIDSIHLKLGHRPIRSEIFSETPRFEVTVPHLEDRVESLLVFQFGLFSSLEAARVVI